MKLIYDIGVTGCQREGRATQMKASAWGWDELQEVKRE